MGGNLLQKWGLPPKRLDDKQFNRLKDIIINRLRDTFNKERIEVIGYFSSKTDHGDIDILLENAGGLSFNYSEELRALFFQVPYCNGGVYSFPVEGFQCDIRVISKDKFDIARAYLSMDSGNLMGVVAKQMGLIYGFDGLHLNVALSVLHESYPNHHFKTFLVTRNVSKIFEILGFYLNVHKEGFVDKAALYDWFVKGKYFRKEYFELDALNHQARMRNRKRPIYTGLLDYIKLNNPEDGEIPDKGEIAEQILAQFPHINEDIDVFKAKLVKDRERSAKFNGNIVQNARPGICGSELGKFLITFAKSFGDNTQFNEWLDSKTTQEVEIAVKNFN